MKITYISSFNATDINSYSGTGYFIPTKLREAGDVLFYIDNLNKLNPIYLKIKRRAYQFIRKNYLIERNPKVLKLWAETILGSLNPASQVIVGYSSQPFAKLETSIPKVFWTDAVFASMIDYYPVYSNLCNESIKDGHNMEHSAIQNASLVVFSSDWAAKEATKHYGVSESKVRVIPYGANIDVKYTDQDILKMAKQKSTEICNLLFLGVEWRRKGGEIAIKIAKELNRMGIPTLLSIVGVDPGEEVKNQDFVKSYGYISKSTKQGQELLRKVISESHFLLLPTQADCTPIVFNEMNAYGIPVITTNEGGISSLITHGINGFMFDKKSKIEVFSECIRENFVNKNRYVDLSRSSFNEYKTRLNWNHSIQKFRDVLNEVI